MAASRGSLLNSKHRGMGHPYTMFLTFRNASKNHVFQFHLHFQWRLELLLFIIIMNMLLIVLSTQISFLFWNQLILSRAASRYSKTFQLPVWITLTLITVWTIDHSKLSINATYLMILQIFSVTQTSYYLICNLLTIYCLSLLFLHSASRFHYM